MDQIREAITQLTGALNAQIEQVKALSNRMTDLEKTISHPPPREPQLPVPRTEADLQDIKRLPDCIRDLQVFDGNPVQYISWVHNVESILADYEIARNKPIYKAILQHIRQKVRGPADTALISYNIFDESWEKIKSCLSLHYADKRDVQTLEYELSVMRQGNSSIDEFYAKVNHQLSLIINKIKTDTYSNETIEALISCYRNRALDVFVRGVSGNISRMLAIQKPRTLPEAYTSCLEFQNLNFRNTSIHPRYSNTITSPTNQMSKIGYFSKPPIPQKNLNATERARIYNTPTQQYAQNIPPPRPNQPKPPIPMEVDPSIKSRHVNYMNRPEKSPLPSSANSSNIPRKQQRLFNTETMENCEEYTTQDERDAEFEEDEENLDMEDYDGEYEENQINFMTEASLAYPI